MESQSILEFAGMTATVGMGVVFSALFFLSIYILVFKKILNGIIEGKEKRAAAKIAAVASKSAEANKEILSEPPPTADSEGLAAAIAVGLYLDGCAGAATEEVVAAIATAIGMERIAIETATHPPLAQGAGGWKMAGWAEAQMMRVNRQRRAAN